MEKIKEGNLYKTFIIENQSFEIFYGYYSDCERGYWDPTPIYPDFIKQPLFTKSGHPFARADQDVCADYLPKENISGENWCNDCKHFNLCEEIIGICRNDDKINKVRQDE